MTDRPTPPPGAIHSRRATWYLLLGFLATLMPMPYNIVAIVALGASAIESVLTLRALTAVGAPAGARAWTGVGLVITAMLTVAVALPYLFWSSTHDYQQCMDGANTQVAKASCKATFSGRMDYVQNLIHKP